MGQDLCLLDKQRLDAFHELEREENQHHDPLV